ncbi:tail fiber protein [Photorhabdus heterorhabditis]|uniref:tail fiber protein n=1 Tax=Photorhabdus heterorhabditis TaxID=880156 RepID=UPI001562314A|nr:tail fiber protein [Photorhabdus heterorhabditis]NRN26863.1 DNA-packaging protein [Photorhabdus heterorhabditis subsp. aluminescens]
MSQKNDFKAFSIGNNANVVNQERYEESQSLLTGFPSENIPIHVLNKVLRQSSTIASVVANFIAIQSDDDVLDDGDMVKLTAKLNRAIKQKVTAEINSASLTQKGIVQLTSEMGNNDTLAVTQKLVQEVVNSLRGNIDGKVPNGRKINGKALIGDINLNASDVGAYTRAEVDKLIKTTSEIPVGSPIPWPLPHPPFGYFTCNGSAFSRSQYPKLAEAYPSGRLPDLRGEFIRGWDDTRGVDNGRKLLSWQDGSSLAEYLGNFSTGAAQNIFGRDGVAYHDPKQNKYKISSLESIGIGVDYFRVRPRNIAFNYIVKAE